MRSTPRAINWNNNSIINSQRQVPISPYRQLNFNPMNQVHVQNPHLAVQNQRYAVPRSIGVSISENRPSDVEAMNLVNQVLESTSPINSRALIAMHEKEIHLSPQKILGHFHQPNPVVPEFQHPKRQAIRETIDIPIQQQMMSLNTFTPVNVEDMPAQSKQQLELSRISGSPEKIQN